MYQAGYQPDDILKFCSTYEKKTGTAVNVTFVPYDEVYETILRASRANNPQYDVVLVDLIWVADLYAKGILKKIDAELVTDFLQKVDSRIMKSFIQNGNILALPFLANIQHFFYNKKILNACGFEKPPRTLEEMKNMAIEAKKLGILKYPIIESLRDKEVLLCELTWLSGCYGGKLQKGDKLIVASKANLKALKFLVSLFKEGLMNPISLIIGEDELRDIFDSGDALFTTNWTYQSRFMNDSRYSTVVGKADIALIPGDLDYGTTVSGYQGLGILSNTDEFKKALDFVLSITSKEFYLENPNEIPIYPSLRIKNVDTEEIKFAQLSKVVDRPNVANYILYSSILRRNLYMALQQLVKPEEALLTAVKDLRENGFKVADPEF